MRPRFFFLVIESGAEDDKRRGEVMSGRDSTGETTLETQLAEIRSVIASAITESSISEIAGEVSAVLGAGKMLRSRLTISVGTVTDTPEGEMISAGAAVELIHAGSLLHDDVIDSGELRRGAPAFWTEKGVSGAILLGDHLVARAFELVDANGSPHLLSRLVKATAEMCDAEIQQELLLREVDADWETCIDIARRKTGSLFAYAAYAGGGEDHELREALSGAGALVGTAYQLADDVLDTCGDADYSGKTVGTDAVAGKVTAASAGAFNGISPQDEIVGLFASASDALTPWPHAASAWEDYVNSTLKPAIDRCLEPACGKSIT